MRRHVPEASIRLLQAGHEEEEGEDGRDEKVAAGGKG